MTVIERIPEAWWDRPMFRFISDLQDIGRNVWVAGAREDGYCLVVDADNGNVSVGHADSYNTLGRWECYKHHYDRDSAHLHARFPIH